MSSAHKRVFHGQKHELTRPANGDRTVVTFIGEKTSLAVDAVLDDVQRVIGEQNTAAETSIGSKNLMSPTPMALD